MDIYYSVKGDKKVASVSNNDLSIDFSHDDHHYVVKVTSKEDIKLIKAKHSFPFNINFKDYYFLNGYQSWTDTKEYKLAKRERNIKKSPHIISHMFAMDKYGDSYFYKYSIRKSHGYDFFYSKGKNESFIYSLNGDIAYLLIELIKDQKYIHLTSLLDGVELKKGEELKVFDFYFFDNYLEGLKSFNKDYPIVNKDKILGYTSWYNYYQNINEEIILRDLDALDSRFNVFQIDDGYETFVGDWFDIDKNKFPNGLKGAVDKIHKKGYKAGIWLAPFAAETKSKLFKEHQNWLIKDKKNKPMKMGGNWSGFYALDFYNLEARDYIKKSLEYYMDLGFDFFKLDFLYASSLKEVNGKSRAMVQKEAYQFLRNVLKDKIILGCGANIINSAHVFDYLRVGPDVSLVFDDVPYMRLFHRERISTKVTIQNTIYRHLFDQRLFGNDPDVFLLRDENIKLSKEQKEALTTINALFGSVLMTSDDIATYDSEKKKILDRALQLFYKAKVTSIKTDKQLIHIEYELDGKIQRMKYNTKKGVLTHE